MTATIGTYATGGNIDWKFTTRQSTGAPAALVGDGVAVYKSNSSAESTTGITLTASFDGRTGLNHVRVATSADGAFYTNGDQFEAVITSGSVNGVSVAGECVGRFILQAEPIAANVTQVNGVAVPASAGYMAVDWGTIVNKTATAAFTNTTISNLQVVDTVTVLVTAQAEPTAPPAANATPLAKLAWMGVLARNEIRQTASAMNVMNDAVNTVIASASVSDNSTTFVRGEFA